MRYICLLAFLLFSCGAFAQADTIIHPVTESVVLPTTDDSHLRISILTCGVGDELYSSFGHSGVRVIDSVRHTDEVYNYGTFTFDDSFYKKFMLGKLWYYLDKSAFNDFMYTYVEEKRNVQEQVLKLSAPHKMAMVAFLETNLKPENKQYRYDYFYDNCATRVRDILPRVMGKEFYFGEILKGKKISYRSIMNQYLTDKHWQRFGMNLLMGSPIDSIMTDDGSMFLPDFIHQGLVHAKYRGEHVVESDVTILSHKHIFNTKIDGPLCMMIVLLVLTALSYLVKKLHKLKVVLRFILLFSTGLLGLIILFMWLGTDHTACTGNYNILWAIPFNIVVAFAVHKKRFWLKVYALAAISLLIVALIIHAIGIQQFPLFELAPLLLCMMYVYVDLYKSNVHVQPSVQAQPQNEPTIPS
ncbi:MAG: DUF4105 domain-containing protein [Sphingobacteriales bacterium]|nr:MAG: DUF4105 domain-containing protein [Sphingobacteriales bacterium]